MRKNFAKIWRKVLLTSFLVGGVGSTIAAVSMPVQAATGINQQLNFQGRLLNAQGATVPDGYYNIEFKIYQDGDGLSVGDTTGSPAGSLKWTEDWLNTGSTQAVKVQNGFLSVQLGSINPFGSSVNWNSDSLWLSMQIGNTSTCTITTTFQSNCGGDGEMVPMKRLSANAYSLNSALLGGLSSAQFLQLGQGVQTDAANATSLFLNKTGTGNIVDLQSGGTDAFIINNSGDINFGANANHNIAVSTSAASVAGKSLTLSAGGAGSGGSALAGGNLVLQGGAGGGTNGNGGNLTIDAGVKNGSGTDGTVSIGTATASSITIGKAGMTSTIGGNLTVNSGFTVGSAAGNGSLTNNGSTVNTTKAISDLSSGGSIGTATTTVDAYTAFAINQTTASQTITLPNPTTTTAGRIIYVSNVGSTSFTLLGTKLNTGSTAAIVWNGSAWSMAGAPTDAILNQSSSAQSANFYIRSAANNKVATVIEGANGQAVDLIQINTYDGTTSSTVTSFDSNGYLHFNKAASVSDKVISARVNADTNDRLTIGADGKLSWGPGNAAADVSLSRSGSGQLSVAGGLTVGNVSSTTAFQVQNNSGNKVLTVDTSGNQAILGQSSQVNGALVFKNSANTNAITLNSTGATASYSLTLPAAAPAGGLCLETSSGNAGQLVFASCANNNSSITEVQEVDANNTNSLTITPSAVGDEIVLTTQIPTSGVTVSSVSGGGVSSWNKVTASSGNGTVNRVEMWVGTVTSTSTSNITVTYSSTPGTEEITATEFTAAGVNSSTSWGIESFANQLNSTVSSTVTFPSLTAVNGSELYVGYGQVQNPPATAGSSSGFNYIVTSTQHNVLTYNTALSANTSYQPSANQNSAGQSNTIAAVLTAFVTSTSINNTTSLQKANFYVQAASAGSVAAVLQAASSGTADVFNVRSSGAGNVLSVGYTGITTFRNSADSSAAFQVQNTAGNNILSVSTSANQVVLGTSGTLGGSLAFANASNSNTISLIAPTTIASTYHLALPSNTPTAGLCLGTSPSDAQQLIFASCATQVSAASISHVNKWSNTGTAVTTVSVSPTSVGNLLIFYSWTNNNVSVSSVSGGGVTNWTKVTSDTSGGAKGNIEMWRGVVTAAGSSTVTVTYSGGAGTNELVAQEFSMGSSSGTWAVDTSGTLSSSTNTTAINYPSLIALNSSELYTGYAYGKGTVTAGSTSGFTYLATSASKYLAYNPSTSAGITYQPTATQTSAAYASIGAIIGAYAGTSVIVNSTAAQQANFNVQAATSGTVAGVLQAASSGTADILQLKNGSGVNIASVNASSGLTLGTSSSISGQLSFAASGNNNLVTIQAPATPGASYILSLPSTTPAPGQCLATSPSDATKLVFSSCADQVTSVAISFVNNWNTSIASNTATIGVSPANIGDLMVLFVSPQKADTVNSVSGGGVSAWSKVASTSSGGGNDTTSMEMWRGQVTSTGSSTITASISGPTGTHELAAMEFTTGSTTGSWVVDSSATQVNASSTTVTYPSLTPQSTKDLYVGYGAGNNALSAGSTSGFTYIPGNLTNREGLYNTALSTTSQPTATQTPAGPSITIGAFIAAYSSSSVISNSTVTQEANLNIQAALNNSVAGVFQAAASGSADVLDILDSSGTLVDSFSNAGNLLVKPSTASASAFQVQTPAGITVLSTDTTNSLVVIGAGAAGESNPSLLVLDSRTGNSSDPTVLNGAMYYNATTHTFRCGVDGTWQSCSGLMYANSSNSSANSNCSSNCGAFSTTASVPANYCQTGRVIRLIANGYFSSQSSPSNVQFGLYYGTDSATASNDTLLGSLSPAESVTSASNNFFQMNFNLICFSTSSMQVAGTLNLQTGTTAAGMTAVPMASTSPTTVSSGSAKNLYVFPIWDTASTSNTATMTQLIVNSY